MAELYYGYTYYGYTNYDHGRGACALGSEGWGAARRTCGVGAVPLRDCESLFAWTGLSASEAIRPSSRSHLYD